MGLLDVYTAESGLFGLGMVPKPLLPHHLILGNLFYVLRTLFKRKYVVLSEYCIDIKDLNSVVPDVIVYDKSMKPMMFIEITNKKEMKRLDKKIRETMEQYSVFEAFMYIYDVKKWVKYSGLEKKSDKISYSDILRIDLAPFVKI